jgi:N-terminal domain on NACHT_NTPase and P-loop NTPases
MDPVAGLGVAANIVAVRRDGNRIKLFKFRDLQLPKAAIDISVQLNVLTETLSRVRDGLERELDAAPQRNLNTVNEVVSCTSERAQGSNQMVEKYLPREDDSFQKKSKKPLLSFAKDPEIEQFSIKLDRYVNLLTLHQITSPHHSDNALPLDRRTFYNVPLRRVAKFIGRNDILLRLDEALDSGPNSTPRTVVLHGMAGQGKMQIALESCRRSKQNKRFSAVFWVNASFEIALRKSFEKISEHLRTPGQAFVDTDSRIAFLNKVLADWVHA